MTSLSVLHQHKDVRNNDSNKCKGELEDTFKAATRRGNHLQEGKWEFVWGRGNLRGNGNKIGNYGKI